jgi:peptidoglycan/xylan/chitin deacetylase (PgdA/CDA1 family)
LRLTAGRELSNPRCRCFNSRCCFTLPGTPNDRTARTNSGPVRNDQDSPGTYNVTGLASLVKSAEALILGGAKRARVLRLVRDSRWRSKRLLILAYHGISLEDEHEWDSSFYMPQELFRRRMESLRAGSYSVLPFEEAVERLYAGELPPRAVSLTFDDGTHDFRARACPVLAEFGFPATVYVTTYFAVNRYPVFNVFFSYLLWKGRNRTVNLSGLVPGLGRHDLATERPAVLDRIREYRQTNRPGDAELCEIGRKLANAVGEDYDRMCDAGILHIMSRAEVAELPRFGVSVQLHTHRHRAPREGELFRREVRDNREQIAAMGIPPETLRHFCYPSGEHRAEFFGWLKAENVKTATTCTPGLASRKSFPLALPRLIDTCNLTPLEFEGWLTGASHFFPRRGRLVALGGL